MPSALLLPALLAFAGCASLAPVARQGPPPALPNEHAADVVLAALAFVDRPYRSGGSGEQGFDCSGFTRHVYRRSLGVELPRSAEQQAAALTAVRDQPQPGDLVFFNTLGRAYSHVGIYVGDGRFVHAPRSGAQIRVEDLRRAYWARRYDGARRVASALPPER